MKTLTIDVLNDKVITLLKELETLKLIKIINTKTVNNRLPARKKVSDYKGIIPDDLGKKMQEYIWQSRDEWQHRIYLMDSNALIDYTRRKFSRKAEQ